MGRMKLAPLPLLLTLLATPPILAQAPLHERTILAQTQVFSYEAQPARTLANGAESRDILRGTLSGGETIAVHESIVQPGTPPNPPHRIQHSEIITILQGTIDFQHDGQSDRLGPGAIIFVAPGTLHALRNVGDTPARYSVVALGGDIH